MLVFLFGILGAHAQDVVAAGPDSSDTDTGAWGWKAAPLLKIVQR